jgi:alkylation response protein AidB-like acyl-CoA dehydrogenase
MGFGFSPEQEAMRESVRRFLRERVAPRVADCERRRQFAWDLLPQLQPFGYLGGLLPEDAGGFAMTYADWAILMEEAGYCWLSLRVMMNSLNILAQLLHRHGTPAQQQRYLKPLLAGSLKHWIAITEPNHGSDVAGIETRAVDRGDHYVVNGSKLWITNGIHGNFGVLVARTFSAGCDGGISLFIVDREQTRYDARRADVMFIRATGTSQLAFEDAVVPKANLLGKEGEGLKAILTGLNFGRLNVAMGAVGAARSALDLSIDYAKQRRQFDKPIAGYQLVQKLIVDMTVRCEAARAGLPRRLGARPGRQCAHRVLDRQALRRRSGARGGRHGAAGPRRLGLQRRAADRAHLPRHPRRHDSRRHDRDPDADHRSRGAGRVGFPLKTAGR